MRFKSRGAASALLVVLSVAWGIAAVAPVTRDTLAITGTVKDSAGAAVANAIVTSGGGGGGMMGSARDTTDASGAYSLTVITTSASRRVTVTAREGTRSGSASDSIPTGASGKISLTINITLRGGGVSPTGGDTVVITGTVKDSTGAAVAGAVVTVGMGGFGGRGDSAVTDASGAFTLTTKNTNGAATLTVMARKTGGGGGIGLGSVGTGSVKITNPRDGVTDHATVAITLGKFTAVLPAPAQKTAFHRAYPPASVYSVDGRSIVASPAIARAAGMRLIREESSKKALMVR